jgi:hypothetical protein
MGGIIMPNLPGLPLATCTFAPSRLSYLMWRQFHEDCCDQADRVVLAVQRRRGARLRIEFQELLYEVGIGVG